MFSVADRGRLGASRKLCVCFLKKNSINQTPGLWSMMMKTAKETCAQLSSPAAPLKDHCLGDTDFNSRPFRLWGGNGDDTEQQTSDVACLVWTASPSLATLRQSGCLLVHFSFLEYREDSLSLSPQEWRCCLNASWLKSVSGGHCVPTQQDGTEALWCHLGLGT